MNTIEKLEAEVKELYERLDVQVAMRYMADAKINAVKQLLIAECGKVETEFLERITKYKNSKDKVEIEEAVKADCFLRGYLRMKNELIPLVAD
jgi:hypothetical protein